MATEGEIALRINLVGRPAAAAGGAGSTAQPTAGGRGLGSDAAVERMARMMELLAVERIEAGRKASAAGGGGMLGLGIAAIAPLTERLVQVANGIVESSIPEVLAQLDRISLAAENSAAQQVENVTGGLARLGVDPSAIRQQLFAQTLPAEQRALAEHRAVRALVGVPSAQEARQALQAIPGGFVLDMMGLVGNVLPGMGLGSMMAAMGRK